jgi:hypothetical protein
LALGGRCHLAPAEEQLTPFEDGPRKRVTKTGLKTPITGGIGVDEQQTTEGIMTLQNIRQKSAAAAAVVGLGALLVGCSRDGVSAAPIAAGTPVGAPLSVSCEPNQRAIVRQVAVNGAFQSQVQCETVVPNGFAAVPGTYAAAPAGYAPAAGYQQVAYQPVAPLDNTQLVRTAYPQQTVVTREVAPRRVVTQRVERVQPKRSVAKSAVIIGSSAGVGAGVGAAIGGKKGAGIGALIGGGSAAIWDQITRRK